MKDNGEIFNYERMDLTARLQSITHREQKQIARFYMAGMKQVDEVAMFLLSMGLVGIRLPKGVRLSPSKGGKLLLQQIGNPYGDSESSWYSLNAMTGEQFPPHSMLMTFLSELDTWLELLVGEMDTIANQGAQALERGEAAIAKVPRLRLLTTEEMLR